MASKWKVLGTEARNDGTGQVAFDIVAIDTDGNDIPDRHKTVLLDDTEIATALASGTANQKKLALKALVAAKLPPEWMVAQLDQTVLQNQAAVTQKAAVDALVANYPITFTL